MSGFVHRQIPRTVQLLSDCSPAQWLEETLRPTVDAPQRGITLDSMMPRNSDGNPDYPQAVVFLTSIIDVTVGS